jgi:pteridine reductase
VTEQPRPAALVTGGAVRLGRALALHLAGAGYDVALHYGRSADAAADTAAEIRALGVDCRTFACDLADVEALDGLMAQALDEFPRLEVLVNSASAYAQAPIAGTTAEMFAQQFEVNLRAPFFLTQAFASRVGRGNVVNVIDNKIGYHQFDYAAYLLSKKALAEFTAMAAVEFAPRIRVNGVAPGVVLPAATRSEEYIAWRLQGIPLRMQGQPSHIAAALMSLLSNEFITGQVITVDGGESLAEVGRNAAQFDQSKV